MATIVTCQSCDARFQRKEALVGDAIEYQAGQYLCPKCAHLIDEYLVPASEKLAHSGLFRRGFAYLIDVIPITLFVAVAVSLLTDFGDVFNSILQSQERDLEKYEEYTHWQVLIRSVSGILYILYSALLEASPLRSTLGKRLLGLQVVDIDAERISFGRALLRNLLKIVSALPAGIGFLIAFFNPRRRTWHDKLSKTYVLKRTPRDA